MEVSEVFVLGGCLPFAVQLSFGMIRMLHTAPPAILYGLSGSSQIKCL